jgi:hypothetical protein
MDLWAGLIMNIMNVALREHLYKVKYYKNY